MNNLLTFGEGYTWDRYQSNHEGISQIAMGSSVQYASSFVITRSNDTFSYQLSSPSTLNISVSSWNKYKQTISSSLSSITITITSGVVPTLQSGTETQLVASSSSATVALSGTIRNFGLNISSSYINTTRNNITSIAGRYVILPGHLSEVYKLPSVINQGNLIIQADSAGNGTIEFRELQLVTASYEGIVTSYDSLSYPDSDWLDNYYYSRTATGSSSNTLKGKYFVVDSTMYYCGSDNVQSSKTQTWTFTEARRYTAVTQTTSAHSSVSTTYPENGYQAPYYYVRTSEPFTIGDESIYGGVKYEQVVNTEDDIEVGATACATIEFDLHNISGLQVGDLVSYSVKQKNDGNNWRAVGKFYISDISKRKNRYTITAYDPISKFDKVVDEWLDTITFPITARDMLTSLCTYCGVTTDSSTFINSSMSLQDNFTSTNLSGRQVLSYIAQLGAGFARCDADGTLKIRTLGFETGTALNNTKYVSLVQQDYTTTAIDRVRVAYDEDSQGVEAGSGNNILAIYGNPLLYFEVESEIEDQVEAIYNFLSANSVYTPMTIEMLEDYGINAGDAVLVNGVSTYIFTKSWDASGVVLESTGNKVRELTNVNKNAEINALRGKVNRVTDTAALHQQVLGDLATGEWKTFSIDAQHGVQIEDQDGNVVQIDGASVKADRIDAGNLNLTGCIKFDDFDTTDTKTARWLETNGQIYRQNTLPTGTAQNPLVNGAMWFINNDLTGGSSWVTSHVYAVNAIVWAYNSRSEKVYYLNNVAHTSHGTSIEQDVDGDGISYWTGLAKNNWYTYNGTTWNVSTNPYYVKSTYIDSVELRSPTITGNEIIVNGDNGGCFQVRKQADVKGYMGVGSSYDVQGNLHEGIVVGTSNNNQQPAFNVNNAFVCLTDNDLELSFPYIENTVYYAHKIYLNSTGAYYSNGKGTIVQLGYARFG